MKFVRGTICDDLQFFFNRGGGPVRFRDEARGLGRAVLLVQFLFMLHIPLSEYQIPLLSGRPLIYVEAVSGNVMHATCHRNALRCLLLIAGGKFRVFAYRPALRTDISCVFELTGDSLLVEISSAPVCFRTTFARSISSEVSQCTDVRIPPFCKRPS